MVEAEAFDGDLPYLDEGRAASLTVESGGMRPTVAARVERIDVDPTTRRARVRLRVDGPPPASLRPGTPATARVLRPIAEVEPFRSLPAGPPPIRQGEPRSAFACPEHAEVVRDAPGKCPVDRHDDLEPRPLLANQRLGWWCPMHPETSAGRPGLACDACGGMTLVPRVVTYRPAGQVLGIPESAVVDTGERTVVFVERIPGTFEGVEVVLGPRCGDAFPVVAGLEPGLRVATAGAFLLDAETRLNPSLAAAYFGASRTARAEAPPPDVDARPIAGSQRNCPVTGKPLGSMGPAVRVSVAGRDVMLCCSGCEEALRKDPDRYLSRISRPGPP